MLNDKNINDSTLAMIYNRLAAIYNEQDLTPGINKIDSVIKYSELSINISKKLNYDEALGYAYNELGYIYKAKNDLSNSKTYFIKAIELFEKNGMLKDIGNTTINLCNILLSENILIEAEWYCEKAIKNIPFNTNEEIHMRLYLEMAKIKEYQKDYYSAYEYLSLARRFQILLLQGIQNKTINDLIAKYDLNLKEKEISLQKQENERKSKQNLFLIILSILLTIILLLSFIIFINKRKIYSQKRQLLKIENSLLKESLKVKQIEAEQKKKQLMQTFANIVMFNKFLADIKAVIKKESVNEALNL
ncbi:MAG: hypothetical protein Kow0068_14960 [Marinilabiliales bacterium]